MPLSTYIDDGARSSEKEALHKTIAELEKRNAALVEDNVRLADAVAARDAFLTIAAHELRNPITPLALRVQMRCVA